MERKLASIQIVLDIKPIEGADMIELVIINGWQVVVKKGEFKVGEKVIYFEIDSFLPIKEEYEFLRKSSYKKMGEQEGFRLKTVKLRGELSQGLVLPYYLLPDLEFHDYEEGEDVTEHLDIVKWEPPISANLAGVARGNFPSFIPKTDEERIQNLKKYYEDYKTKVFYVAEKLDGSSATFYLNNGVFGVCSRNLDLIETEGNSFWKAARDLDIETKLRSLGFNLALQGELIGEGIQGNPYKIKGQKVYFFNAYDIDLRIYLDFESFIAILKKFGLDWVPILNEEYMLPETIDELLKIAEGKSDLNPQTEREGLVIRSLDREISFKVISNKFLLKEK
jgi:RNA ligase (TIGR02306 family)